MGASSIYGIDIDQQSVNCAQLNFQNSLWCDSLKTCVADLSLDNPSTLKWLQEFNPNYIISNPPFFKNSLLSENDNKNRTRHQLNLNFYTIAQLAQQVLSQSGKIALIFPVLNEEEVTEIMLSTEFYPSRILRYRNQVQSELKRVIIEFSRVKQIPEEKEFYLYEKSGKRSLEYHQLTDPFYI